MSKHVLFKKQSQNNAIVKVSTELVVSHAQPRVIDLIEKKNARSLRKIVAQDRKALKIT